MKNYANLTRQERIKVVLENRRPDVALILENLSEELNMSAILRSAESFGIGQIYIIHLEGKKPRLSKNTSSGATKWLEINYSTNIEEVIDNLKKSGFKIFGALVDPSATPLPEADLSGQVAFVLGNEAQGMSGIATELVDQNLYIPMHGLTESFNVSVSAGIFLYEAIRQRS